MLSIVAPAGILSSKGYGRAHANGTGNGAPSKIGTIYWRECISKTFAALENLILRGHGVLSWYGAGTANGHCLILSKR